jgi:hypothetical protein
MKSNIQVPVIKGSFIGHHIRRLAFYESYWVTFPHPHIPNQCMRIQRERPVYHEFTWNGKSWTVFGAYRSPIQETPERKKKKSRVRKIVEEVQESPVPKRIKRVLRKKGSKEFKEMK